MINEPELTIPAWKRVTSTFQSMGRCSTTVGMGRKPPSVPIEIQLGPRVFQSGTPPSRPSMGQLGLPLAKSEGQLGSVLDAAGTIPTSVGALYTDADAVAPEAVAPPPVMVTVGADR